MDKDVRPRVSVIMPVYNCEEFVAKSIQSILSQTFPDFELIIIDDASKDNTLTTVNSFNDQRIRVIKKEVNSGYTKSLNIGLELANGDFIARMDGDDISLPDRLKEQVDFLDKNPDIMLCGTWFNISPGDLTIKHPCKHIQIKTAFLEYCAIAHPTVMFRRTLFAEFGLKYDPAMEPAEDYDLWVKILTAGKLANIPKVHLIYRLHDKQVSVVYKQKQENNANTIRTNLLELLYDTAPSIDIKSIFFFQENKDIKRSHLERFENEISLLKKLNQEKHFFAEDGFRWFIERKRNLLITLFFASSNKFNWQKLACFLFSPKGYYRFFKNRDKLKIIANCLLCSKVYFKKVNGMRN